MSILPIAKGLAFGRPKSCFCLVVSKFRVGSNALMSMVFKSVFIRKICVMPIPSTKSQRSIFSRTIPKTFHTFSKRILLYTFIQWNADLCSLRGMTRIMQIFADLISVHPQDLRFPSSILFKSSPTISSPNQYSQLFRKPSTIYQFKLIQWNADDTDYADVRRLNQC